MDFEYRDRLPSLVVFLEEHLGHFIGEKFRIYSPQKTKIPHESELINANSNQAKRMVARRGCKGKGADLYLMDQERFNSEARGMF